MTKLRLINKNHAQQLKKCRFPLSGSVSCSSQKCRRGLEWLNGAYAECI